jgi:ATP:corrinoid adenosyltransferase
VIAVFRGVAGVKEEKKAVGAMKTEETIFSIFMKSADGKFTSAFGTPFVKGASPKARREKALYT